MTLPQLTAKVFAAKNVYIGAAILGGLLWSALAALKVPAKLEQHIVQADSIKSEQQWTNRKLDVLICLQAKLDTPIRCVSQNK